MCIVLYKRRCELRRMRTQLVLIMQGRRKLLYPMGHGHGCTSLNSSLKAASAMSLHYVRLRELQRVRINGTVNYANFDIERLWAFLYLRQYCWCEPCNKRIMAFNITYICSQTENIKFLLQGWPAYFGWSRRPIVLKSLSLMCFWVLVPF